MVRIKISKQVVKSFIIDSTALDCKNKKENSNTHKDDRTQTSNEFEAVSSVIDYNQIMCTYII